MSRSTYSSDGKRSSGAPLSSSAKRPTPDSLIFPPDDFEELDRLRDASANSPFAVVVLGPDGRIVSVNERVLSLFGMEETQMIGAGLDTLRMSDRKRSRMTQPIHVESLVETVMTAISLPDNIVVESQIDVDWISGVRTAVATSLYDLVSNAIRDCAHEDGRVSLTCSAENGWCRFLIEDRSTGTIKYADTGAPHIRAEASRRAGSGMETTRDLVERNGGRLDFDLPAPGAPASYRIWWPLAHP